MGKKGGFIDRVDVGAMKVKLYNSVPEADGERDLS